MKRIPLESVSGSSERRPLFGNAELGDTIREFMQIVRLHRKLFERLVESSGVHPGQHRMLAYLNRMEGAQSQKDLAEYFEISPAAVASMLKKMEAAGVVERCAAEEDGRQKEIRLTDKGRAIVEKTGEQFIHTDVAMLNGFSDEELETLRGYLTRMRENLLHYEKEDGREPSERGND